MTEFPVSLDALMKRLLQRIRELMTPIALRGMAANEVGRARISMMVRSMSSDTRPDTLVQDRRPSLIGFSCNARRVHTLGSCVDGARGSRIFWLSACGRVQVMCPACLRGAHDRWP